MPKERSVKKRLFVAHMVNIKRAQEVRRTVDKLKIQGKWVEPENLHFTYRFLGDFEVDRVDSLKFELKEKLKGLKAPEVTYRGLGVFPNLKSPKVLWIGVDSEDIFPVKEQIDLALEKFGFENEKKVFRPHVTLMRIKRLKHSIKFKSFLYSMREEVFLTGVASSVSLIESKLTEKGPIYREIMKVELE